MKKFLLLILILSGSALSYCSIILPSIFSDNMMFQQKKAIRIWGKADKGELITVSFNGQEKSTETNDSLWSVELDPIAYGGPYEMIIVGKKDTIIINNIMVGEVWVAGGQSNMKRTLAQIYSPEEVMSIANDSMIRIYYSPVNGSATPIFDNPGKWTEAYSGAAQHCSAVAWFFAQKLRNNLNVPVGIINTAVGGSSAQQWMSMEALKSDQYFHNYVPDNQKVDEYIKAICEGEKRLDEKSKTFSSLWYRFMQIDIRFYKTLNTGLFNGMLAPIMPFNVCGIIWYQGEANTHPERAIEYRKLFPALINDWRKGFKDNDLPFLFVQLTTFGNQPDRDWPLLREAQQYTADIVENTGMAVTIDLGMKNDIHPPWKKPVGYRLALIASNKVYGKDVEYSAPRYEKMDVTEEKVILYFNSYNGGLKQKGEKLSDFEICGDDGLFRAAQALIKGDRIEVWSDMVYNPKAVRYGWKNWFVPTLYGMNDLPVAPFRTNSFYE